MKVLFVGSGNSEFGISPIVRKQGESLIRHHIDLCYFSIMGRGVWGYVTHLFKLKKRLSSDQFDLIHAHYGLSGVIALLARKNEKILVSYMGSDLLGDVNRRGHYTLFGKLLVAINKYFADKYDYVIVKSQQLSETLKPGVNHDIIPNGVDLDTFTEKIKSAARTFLKIPEDQKLILFVADPPRLEKNFKLARQSIKLLNDDSIMFTVVSGIPKDRLVLFYNAADVLLLTSIHEGSPNNIKEAMACNCPIVATDVGDVRWVIGNTDGCYLASSAPDDIADKLELALEFSKKYGRTTGRDRIVELGLDSNTIARKIIAVYHHLLSREKR